MSRVQSFASQRVGAGQTGTRREFGDVVFEDVGFENDSWLTINNWRCGDFTPKAFVGEGFENSSLQPHIPEHPNLDQRVPSIFLAAVPGNMFACGSEMCVSLEGWVPIQLGAH